MKPSEIDTAIQYICPSIKNQSVYDLNTRIVQKLQKLHHIWNSRADVFALLEANYLVDFYSSHLINFCDSNNQYDNHSPRKSPTTHHKTARKFLWDDGSPTYEVFKHQVLYADGFRTVKRFILDIRKRFLKNIAILAPDQVTPFVTSSAHMIDLDWKTMLQRYPLQVYVNAAELAVNEATTYHASSWGLYRLINMHNFHDKRPASCIVNSLVLLSILYMTGFPQDFLTAHYQIPNGASYKKYTHWAMSCVHPFETTSKKQFASSSVINTMDTALVTTFWGTKVFLTFTKDILRYYKSATHRFQYAPGSIDGATRRLVLDDLHAKLKQQPFSTK